MTRVRRVLVQLALLPVLWVIADVSRDAFTTVVAISLLVVWPLSLAVAGILVWLVRTAEQDPEHRGVPATLAEAAENAVSLALVETGLAAVAGIAALRLFGIVIGGQFALVILGWSLIILGAPSLSWLRTLRDVWIPMLNRRR